MKPPTTPQQLGTNGQRTNVRTGVTIFIITLIGTSLARIIHTPMELSVSDSV